jgi:hypothetical protein
VVELDEVTVNVVDEIVEEDVVELLDVAVEVDVAAWHRGNAA